MRDGSLAMGATNSETIRRVLIPAALPGIVAGVMLAISRAIGETMIVVMAASTAANLSANPLDRMTTVTVQIVKMLTGEGSFDHPATLALLRLASCCLWSLLASTSSPSASSNGSVKPMSERIAPTRTAVFEKRLKKRYSSEQPFQGAGLGAILFSVLVLAFLLVTMTLNGIGGFQRAELTVPIDFTRDGYRRQRRDIAQVGAVQRLEAQGLPRRGPVCRTAAGR